MISSVSPRAASRSGSGRCLLLSAFAVTALALPCGSCGHSPGVVVAFRTEQQAQQHCPDDTVVWVDPLSGAYYLKGHGSYGKTNAGRYACRGDADNGGMREMPN